MKKILLISAVLCFCSCAFAQNECTNAGYTPWIYGQVHDSNGVLHQRICVDTNGNLITLATTCTGSSCTPPPNNQPTISCSPLSLIFAATNTNQPSVAQSVNCTNTSTNGASALFTAASFATGTNFSQTTTCSTLAPGASCSYSIIFTPTTTSTSCGLTDTLTIPSNATSVSVAVCGDGQTPAVPTPSSVTITPGSPSLAVNATSDENSSLVMSDSSARSGNGMEWNSATTSVATVNAGTGVVTGVAAGTSVISANGGFPVPGQRVEVQGGTGPFSTEVLAFPSAISKGDRLACAVMWGAATGTVSGLTDTLGNSFTAIAGTLKQANGNSAQWWTAIGSPSGTDSVTVTWAAGVAFPDVVCLEVAGDTAVDQAAVGTSTASTTVSTTAITPAQASEVIIAAGITSNAFKQVSAGFYCLFGGTAAQTDILGGSCPQSGAGSEVAWQGTFSTSAVTPTFTTNSSANNVISAIALKSISGSTTATVTAVATSYSASNEPAQSYAPYISSGTGGSGFPSIFTKDLQTLYGSQSALLSHLWGNTSSPTTGDAFAQFWFQGQGGDNGCTASTDGCGLFNFPNANNTNGTDVTFVYSTASDPWWSASSTQCPLGSPDSFKFHAPNNAPFTGNAGDMSLLIFDQAQGLIIQFEANNKGTGFNLGTSTCSGTGSSSCAQPIPSIGYCAAARIGSDSDYSAAKTWAVTSPGTYTLGGTLSSAGEAPYSDYVRFSELNAAVIDHAVEVATPCVANSGPGVFPSPGGLLKCASPPAHAPQAGMWFIADYTDAQIAAWPSTVDPVVKAFWTAASHYGFVLTQTSGGTTSFTGFALVATGSAESIKTYQFANAPLTPIASICSANTHLLACSSASYSTAVVEGYLTHNIPLTGCTGAWCGTDDKGRVCSSTACDPVGHIHLLDPCVAKNLANIAGKCT